MWKILCDAWRDTETIAHAQNSRNSVSILELLRTCFACDGFHSSWLMHAWFACLSVASIWFLQAITIYVHCLYDNQWWPWIEVRKRGRWLNLYNWVVGILAKTSNYFRLYSLHAYLLSEMWGTMFSVCEITLEIWDDIATVRIW